ncbi:HAMP domain-containing sensor histidine kinase [Ciceribacter sp. L1K22]|uniref:sensor histidine kinase n=1 Tax=Ciceribacter sp. L1K22 TaxID=2820275 RepID=UPI001ABE723D|nr:HAMP domain-containing sensor histidine kinase [Ciceribacter sp. L1K22]MBO3758848.1 HAMP domain-containing histidine kinase [Ciceribacter sp. L1K22]
MPGGQADGQQRDEIESAAPRLVRGLSTRLLWLTVMFVMIAEVLIFVPSIANMRLAWLRDRLNTAGAASVVIDGLQPIELPRAVQDSALMATGTKAIALRSDGTSKLLAVENMPPQVDLTYDLRDVPMLDAVRDALSTLLFGGDRIMQVYGPVGDSDTEIELLLEESSLRNAMLAYARQVFSVSIIISLFTAVLIFLAINRMMIVPMRRLTRSMQAFAAEPENPARVLRAGSGGDEIAVAERHLAAMQEQLQKTLKQQKNLADLGLAVSKINHDMRNILASAQLMSDRLVDVEDPMVKSFAPKLLRTIDRAVGYTSEVLAYGQASEAEPRRRRFPLCHLVQEVRDILAIDPAHGIQFVDVVPEDLEVDADSEQLFRVIHNICRNAVQALSNHLPSDASQERCVTLTAHRVGTVVSISIDDTGPGMPPKARENLFAAFRGSARSGGTGLGLAIARELVLAHRGTIALVEKPDPGTLFRIEIPDRPVALEDWRARLERQ